MSFQIGNWIPFFKFRVTNLYEYFKIYNEIMISLYIYPYLYNNTLRLQSKGIIRFQAKNRLTSK